LRRSELGKTGIRRGDHSRRRWTMPPHQVVFAAYTRAPSTTISPCRHRTSRSCRSRPVDRRRKVGLAAPDGADQRRDGTSRHGGAKTSLAGRALGPVTRRRSTRSLSIPEFDRYQPVQASASAWFEGDSWDQCCWCRPPQVVQGSCSFQTSLISQTPPVPVFILRRA